MRRFSLISLFLIAGCATEHLNTERMLAAAQFDQRKIDTPERKATVAELPPYTFLKMAETKKGFRYAFISPARKTAFFGDEAAMQRYVAHLTAQEQSNQMRRLQAQQRAANFQQALATGLAAGAMQQPVYQQPLYQPPPTVNVGSAFGQTTRYQPDFVGGLSGSDGTRIQPDGLGGYNVTTY